MSDIQEPAASLSWYFGNISKREAADLLRYQNLGRYLLRDSSDPIALFTLSVRGESQIIHLRIYKNHKHTFYLSSLNSRTDSDGSLLNGFESLQKLIKYYKENGTTSLLNSNGVSTRFHLTGPLIRQSPSPAQNYQQQHGGETASSAGVFDLL